MCRLLAFACFGSLLLAPTPASACKCGEYDPSFLAGAAWTPLVVVANVQHHLDGKRRGKPNSLEVALLRVLKGHEARATLRISAMGGANCQANAHDFTEGSSWVMALSPVSARMSRRYREAGVAVPDFVLLGMCGTFYLEVAGGNVRVTHEGEWISEVGERELPLEALAQRLRRRTSPRTSSRGR
ncbi:MAG: hypothetical protein HYZ28_24285 [Myxococcales bacterium]|nr:hypothetical protein [Myxococcales bacterium]